MEELIERIFEMMEGIESDPDYVAKSWILGQISGIISKGTTPWKLIGCKGMSIEMLNELLEKLGVSHGEISFADGVYIIPVNQSPEEHCH